MTQGASLHRRVVIDGDPAPVRGMRSMLTSFLKDRSIDAKASRAIVLAFSEALENAVEHGLLGAKGEVSLRLRYTRTFILVSLRDSGSDRSPIGDPVSQDEDAERGRGFELMHKLMDRVKVRSCSGGGTRVSMLRYLSRDGQPDE